MYTKSTESLSIWLIISFGYIHIGKVYLDLLSIHIWDANALREVMNPWKADKPISSPI
jgi:hypothetical protein